MGAVRFPYRAWQRWSSEAPQQDDATLERWAHSPTKAKRIAARQELQNRRRKKTP